MQTEINDDFLNEVLEVEQVGNYFKKTAYAGKTIYAIVKGVRKNNFNDKKLDLEILIDGQDESVLLGLSKVDKNSMMTHFGNKPREWIGKKIKIEIGQITTWDGGNGLVKTGATSKISKA